MRGHDGVCVGLLAVLALVASTGAFAQAFEVTGSCRDGLPNGNYELRMPDTRLRVVGAFAHGRKTGTFIFWNAGGARIAVVPYDDDQRNGTVALWYVTQDSRIESGRRLEAPFVADRLHGVLRSWYPSGLPRAEYRYERGRLVEARAWTDAGSPLSDADAASSATSDAEADQRMLDELVALVQEHLPRCD
jgi:hypothetical protein